MKDEAGGSGGDENPLIRTTDPRWLDKALDCYKEKRKFTFIDDAKLGIREIDLESALSLIKRARETGGISWREIARILTGLGLSAAGIWLVAVAIADPEPTSKLSILLVGGVLLIATGGLSILRTLGQKWQVSAKTGDTTITVNPA